MPTSLIETRIDDTDTVADVVNILQCACEGINGQDGTDFDVCADAIGALANPEKYDELIERAKSLKVR